MFQCIDCLMEIDDEEDYACWGTGAEMLSRPGTVLTRDDGDLILQSSDNEGDEIACWGTGAAMLSRQGTVLVRDDGGRVLRLSDNEEEEEIKLLTDCVPLG